VKHPGGRRNDSDNKASDSENLFPPQGETTFASERPKQERGSLRCLTGALPALYRRNADVGLEAETLLGGGNVTVDIPGLALVSHLTYPARPWRDHGVYKAMRWPPSEVSG
jgi:hypothetical protein